ncbi:MAG: hypothetical protein FWB72_00285 [Firmicutes bacterium]|nr:hypothetical protein [Bacillota bacterium]
MENREIKQRLHSVTLENRKKMSLTGISKVDTFNDKTITLHSSHGRMVVEGSELNVKRFAEEEGLLNIEGNIKALKYIDATEKKSLGKKLFR